MSLFVFGDSWGTPWRISNREHFLYDPTWVNYSQAGACLSHIRHTFFEHLSEIDQCRDSVFFVIPPDIRLFFPEPVSHNSRRDRLATRSVHTRDWSRAFKGCSLESIYAYFSQVLGSELLLLSNTCRILGIDYCMWHNYGKLDFMDNPYMVHLDRSRFVSRMSMMGHLLGYETDLEPGADGPSVELTNTSKNFLHRDQHPSPAGHATLRSIYENWLNTTL